MGFWMLLELSFFAVVEVVSICLVGALMGFKCNIFAVETRKILTKIVLTVFLPCIMFYNLVANVTLKAFISWWFIPVNLAITNLVGGVIGWVLVKIARPDPNLSGLIISICSSGNVANILLIMVPAVCSLNGSPFENADTCSSVGHSYVAYSMACCGAYCGTYTYHLMQKSSRMAADERDASLRSPLLRDEEYGGAAKAECALIYLREMLRSLGRILDPAFVASMIAVAIGSASPLRTMLVGEKAPLKFILDTVLWIGNATVPTISLILGGNLTEGRRGSKIEASLMMGMICVRYVLIPAAGVLIVAAAAKLGFLLSDPIFRYVLLIHYCLPPAMQIGNMAQTMRYGEDECWAVFLWLHVVGIFALTLWSAIFIFILPMLPS